MNIIRVAAVSAIVILTSGCETDPRLTYSTVESPQQLKGSEIDTYFLQGSRIRVVATAPETYAISSVPSEAPGLKLAILPANAMGLRTHMNVAKMANTDLVSEIGVEVIDKRVQYIEDAASVLKVVLPLAAFAAEPIDPAALPMDYDLTPVFRNTATNKKEGFPHVTDKKVQIDIGPLPPDAESLSDFREKLPITGNQFYYAACRTAKVIFAVKGDKNATTAQVKVADPTYIQRIALPVKGKVTMHSECGASVTTDKDSTVASDAAIVKALAVQAQGIKDALDAAAEKEKGKK